MTTKENESAVISDNALGVFLTELAAVKTELMLVKAATQKFPTPAGDRAMRRSDHPEPGGAWVVSTPMAEYSGDTCGVAFVGGIGIVDEDMPDADRVVHQLEHDFHYLVKSIPGVDVAAARKLQMTRGARKPQQSLAEKLSGPAGRVR